MNVDSRIGVIGNLGDISADRVEVLLSDMLLEVSNDLFREIRASGPRQEKDSNIGVKITLMVWRQFLVDDYLGLLKSRWYDILKDRIRPCVRDARVDDLIAEYSDENRHKNKGLLSALDRTLAPFMGLAAGGHPLAPEQLLGIFWEATGRILVASDDRIEMLAIFQSHLISAGRPIWQDARAFLSGELA